MNEELAAVAAVRWLAAAELVLSHAEQEPQPGVFDALEQTLDLLVLEPECVPRDPPRLVGSGPDQGLCRQGPGERGLRDV